VQKTTNKGCHRGCDSGDGEGITIVTNGIAEPLTPAVQD